MDDKVSFLEQERSRLVRRLGLARQYRKMIEIRAAQCYRVGWRDTLGHPSSRSFLNPDVLDDFYKVRRGDYNIGPYLDQLRIDNRLPLFHFFLFSSWF